MRYKMLGITLLELMIVVAIVGALAAIAYPNYREYSARAQRTEARAMLLEVATQQEKFYLQNSTYAANMTALGYANNNQPTAKGKYTVSITNGDAAGYTVRADYQFSDVEAGKCDWFELDEAGTRTSGPKAPSECWSR